MEKIIVQKFGGTSLSNDQNREKVAEKIIEKYNDSYDVVVVVSAIGRKGNPYSTDSLLDLVNKKLISKREMDLLISCGEVISAVVLSNLLMKKGLNSIVLTGYQAGIITDNYFGDAEIIEVEPSNIINNLRKNKVVIVTGFQGSTKEGEITTLGRGGSDISAVALAKALNCDSVEIYTDVDGIMTADPNIVPNAKVLEKMCYPEVYQLAEDGAKIIHPRAVEIAQQSNIKILIKNTFSESKGTIIKGRNLELYKKASNDFNDKIITAITYKKNRVQIILYNTKNSDMLIEQLAKNNISIDLINFFMDKKIFTIDGEDKEKIINILNNNNCKYKLVEDCCKLSAIGYKMRGVPGVMARIVKALSSENIDILQSSDSHNTIWCLVKEEDVEKAVRALHKEFRLYE